jgi:hypothetical protein
MDVLTHTPQLTTLSKPPQAAGNLPKRLNILKKGVGILDMNWQSGKCGLGVSPSRAIF